MKKCSIFLFLLLASFAQAQNTTCAVRSEAEREMLSTIKNIDEGRLYELDYTLDYQLDKVIDADIRSINGLVKHVVFKMLCPFRVLTRLSKFKPGCSAFQAVTPDGDIIYARNFDFTFPDTAANLMLRTHPDEGYQSVSMVATSLLGKRKGSLDDGKSDNSILIGAPYMLMDGMNEKGLAVSVLYIDGPGTEQYDKSKHDVMTSVAMRLMLDRCATVGEALDCIAKYNMFANKQHKGKEGSYHFLLADAEGNSMVLEYILKDGESSWTMSPVAAKYVTNAYLNEGWENIGHGYDRYDKLKETYEQKSGIFTVDEAMALLQAVSQTPNGEKTSNTQWSAVYNLTQKTVTVSMARRYDKVMEFGL